MLMRNTVVFLLLEALIVCYITATLDFLRRYETFSARVTEQDRAAHKYIKRSTNIESSLPIYRFSFRRFNEVFDLILDEKSPLINNATLSIHDRPGQYRESPLVVDSYYHGSLQGDPGAQVRGKVHIDGTFDGIIHSGKLNNTYFVEPTFRYPQLSTRDVQIIYRYRDLDFTKYPNLTERSRGVRVAEWLRKHKYKLTNKRTRQKRHVDGKGLPIEHLAQQSALPSMHCPLHLYVDHNFFEMIGQSNIAGTIDTVVDHVEQADAIFRSTSFDGQGSNNIGFIIAKITLFKTAQTNPLRGVKDGDDSQDYLNIFSSFDHSKYCLGVMFGVTDFAEGVLGLAWIANVDSLDAGICSEAYTLNNGTTLSFNSAIISYVNYGKRIPKPMFTITVTHELGHNFGSEHDNSSRYSCAPGGDDGNYIMFHLSGDGSRPNHYEFSSCSINQMYRILLNRMQVCFQEQYIAFCSNARIDSDSEECDCGTESTCASVDSCCNVFSPNSSNQCTLKPTAKCSAVASRCCSPTTCDYTPASERELCSLDSECTERTYCDGASASCPTPVSLPNGTLCNQNLMVCMGGTCTVNVCVYHGYKDCYCTDTENDCLVCCKDNSTGECKPATAWGFEAGVDGSIPVNGICVDESGRCDDSGLCRFPNGTYAKADIILLVKKSAEDFIDLLTEYWYYAILSFAAMIGLLAMFVFIHRSSKPVQSIAYKDGRMAYVWFEARHRLAKIESEIESLNNYNPPHSLPYPVAARRIAYQFPTAPQSLYSRYLLLCDREQEVVKLLLLQGYPMRKLLADDKDDQIDQLAIEKTLARADNDQW